MKKINYLFTLLLALVICGNAWGTVITVGTSGADYVKFDEARNAASAGDEIKFVTDQTWSGATEGTHKGYLSKNLTINFNGKTITRTGGSNIFSTNGAQNIIFTGTEGSRVVYSNSVYALRFYNGPGGTFTFQGNIRIDAPMPFGSLSNSCTNTVTIAEGATLTITGDIVDPKTTFINNGTLIIDGGTFEGTNGNKAFTGNYVVKSGLFKQSVYDTYVDGHMPAGTLTGTEGGYIRVAQPIANPVAQIGVAQYATLTAAVAAASDGNEIDLVKDITETIDSNPLTKKRIVIDFNGHTWTNSGHLRTGATELTLKSSTGVGKYVGNHTSTIYLQTANCVLTIDNVQVSGGTSNDIGISQAGTSVVIKNGTTFAKSIANGTYAFTLKFDNVPYSKLWNGTGAVSVVNLGTMTLTKNPSEASSFTNSGTLIIDGGTYTTNNVFNGTYTIKSGLFLKSMYDNDGLASHVLAGSLIEDNMTIGANTYVQVAQPVPGATVKIGVQGYTSLDDAINASISGQTIKLLADINYLDKDFPATSGVTFDKGEYHIYVNQGLYTLARKDVIDPASGYKWADVPRMANTRYRVVANDAPFVAEMSAKKYYTFNDAINDMPDSTASTIKLLANTTSDEPIYIDSNRDVTWNFNGFDLTFVGQNDIVIYTGSSLDLIGQGHLYHYTEAIWLMSSTEKFTTQTKLHVGKDITIENLDTTDLHYSILCYYSKVGVSEYKDYYSYGIRVNVEGHVGKMYVQGYIGNPEDCPEITIAKTATTDGAYAAGYGKWTIEGGTHNSTYEMRAGELTINGGTFINESTEPVVFSSNGSGSTLKGGSCNVALSQHSTKHATMVTINGGTFSSISPIAQANPQENEEESAKLVKCYIKGGLFKSTSASPDSVLISQENNRIFATAGFYNKKPIAKCIATGYQAIPITKADYPTQFEDGYYWRIGLPEQKGTTETITTGNWNETSTWKDGVVPSDSVKAIIKNDVIVNTTAQAYGVSYESTGTLTIKDNGLLIVGKGLIADATIANFKVEGDGQLAILPETLCQPQATVEYVAKYAGKKEDITTVSSVDDVYWEQMAVPTIADLTMTEPDDCGGAHYYNTWDITEGWKAVQKTDVKDSYTGYFLTNFSDYSATTKNKAYTFTGKLAGNKINTLNFIREGYTFFGNSCLAPMSIPELLMELNTNDIQATVYVYKPLSSNYFTINMATVGRGGRPTEINKLQGFFIYAKKKTSAAPSYSDVIWNPLLAKLSMGAPARKAAMQSTFSSAATLTITSAKGWSDDVVLFEGDNLTDEFDQNYDAQKMMGDYVNVYVPATTNMAVHAVADLENTPITVATTNEVAYTFTFSDLEGAQLELVDAETQTVTPMVEGGSYEFVAQANTTIAGRFSVRKAPDTTTDLQSVGAQAQKGIYTVMGQYIGEVSMWDALPNGVYVVNGQKVVK